MEFSMVGPPKSGTFFGVACMKPCIYIYIYTYIIQFVGVSTSWNFQLSAPRNQEPFLVVLAYIASHAIYIYINLSESRHNGIFNCRPPEIRNLFWWCVHDRSLAIYI